MLDYSQRVQILLPIQLDFSNIFFNDLDLLSNFDLLLVDFSNRLNLYLKSCLKNELDDLPDFCLPSEILVDIKDQAETLDRIEMTNIPNENIFRAIYRPLRKRLIYYLLEIKLTALGIFDFHSRSNSKP